MPCRCAGIRVEKCECAVLGAGYPCGDGSGRYLLVTHSDPERKLHTTNGFIKTLETLYDKCAGYNLRYCPMRGAVSTGNYLNNALKDLVILLCFVLANLVVLVTILCKTAVDIYYIMHASLRWLKKQMLKKSVTEDPTFLGYTEGPHNFSPKIK